MWHVSSRSGVATLRTAIHLLLTYLLTYLLCPDNYSRGYYPGAVRPHVDLLPECGEWLAKVVK